MNHQRRKTDWLQIKYRLQRHFPNLPLDWDYFMLVRIEVAVIIIACVCLYIFRVHPYIILTSQSIQQQRQINQEISATLFKRYSEQIHQIEGWWKSHVVSSDQLPQLLERMNPTPGGTMITSLKAGEITPSGDYRMVKIDTLFQGTYTAFLGWMRYLETMPFFVQVETVELRPRPLLPDAEANPPPTPMLIGNVVLRVILKS